MTACRFAGDNCCWCKAQASKGGGAGNGSASSANASNGLGPARAWSDKKVVIDVLSYICVANQFVQVTRWRSAFGHATFASRQAAVPHASWRGGVPLTLVSCRMQ